MQPESALEFPCDFPIKVMGKSNLELDLLVLDIVSRHAKNISANNLSTRTSRGGNYISVTITVFAHSKAQLDAIYTDLTAHPHVLWVL